MTNHTLDAGIPVLTEIIPSPHPGAAAETRPAAPFASPKAKDDISTLEARASEVWDDEQWNRMERDIRERVLYQIIERIDFVLEQRVRDSLADVLQTAVEGLASEIKGGLHHSIKDVVTRAVAHEISKLQTTKK